MIRHVVMWKLKEHAEGADRAANVEKMRALLESCRAVVPGIVEFDVGVAAPASGLEATYDVVLVSTFANRAALDAYQAHPDHAAIIPFIAAVREARQCVDYAC